jgi:hypothetical protein
MGRTGDWEAMFLPDGEGSVGWRVGWAAEIPDELHRSSLQATSEVAG